MDLICYTSWRCSHFCFLLLTGAVCAVEISPVLPPQAGEKQADNRSLTRLLLDALLEYMVTEVSSTVI